MESMGWFALTKPGTAEAMGGAGGTHEGLASAFPGPAGVYIPESQCRQKIGRPFGIPGYYSGKQMATRLGFRNAAWGTEWEARVRAPDPYGFRRARGCARRDRITGLNTLRRGKAKRV